MFYKIGKKLFLCLINAIQFIRVTLVFLAFAVVLYWILSIARVQFVEFFAPFFEAIKAIVHTFYTRTVAIDEVTIDFSFLIASFIMLAIVWLFGYIVDFIKDMEFNYDAMHQKLKNKSEEFFNTNLERDYHRNEKRVSKFMIMIRFSAKDCSQDKFYRHDEGIGVKEKQKKALVDFWEDVSETLKFKEKFFDDSLLLYFDNFAHIENIISEIEKDIKLIKSQYLQEGWVLHSYVSIDNYSNKNTIPEKIDALKLLLNLNLKDEILCLGTFKQRYLLVKHSKFTIEGKGIYRLKEEEEVFCIKTNKTP